MNPGKMRLWSVDADDVGEITDGLLYETEWIRRFLAYEDASRFLLVASKGYGKTLLLRAKRLRLEKDRQSINLMPDNALTDKPMGKIRIFSKKDIERIVDDGTYWENVWLLSIAIAVLKLAQSIWDEWRYDLESEYFESKLGPIYGDSNLKTATDHLPLILGLGPNEYYKALDEFTRRIAPIYRNLNIPIASFIDNVDEYLNYHLESDSNSRASTGAVEKEFWYAAQIGLASAIRTLHGQNHHIKIYASIRKEAFEKLIHESQTALQFDGSAVKIEYGVEDLRQIFIRNLLGESPENLVDRSREKIFEKFFGKENCRMWHPHVGEPENTWEYILRHTLLRPRDLMTIGAKLSATRPIDRTRDEIRRAVNEASTAISASYLNEIKPHFTNPIDFDALFSLIPKNILSKNEIADIAAAYNRKVHGQDIDITSAEFVHAFLCFVQIRSSRIHYSKGWIDRRHSNVRATGRSNVCDGLDPTTFRSLHNSSGTGCPRPHVVP